MAKMEVKTSLLDNMIGVGDMVLLEPLTEETFINNLKKRFDHNEIYVSRPARTRVGFRLCVLWQRAGSSSSNSSLLFSLFSVCQSPEVFVYTLSQSSVFAQLAHK